MNFKTTGTAFIIHTNNVVCMFEHDCLKTTMLGPVFKNIKQADVKRMIYIFILRRVFHFGVLNLV